MQTRRQQLAKMMRQKVTQRGEDAAQLVEGFPSMKKNMDLASQNFMK